MKNIMKKKPQLILLTALITFLFLCCMKEYSPINDISGISKLDGKYVCVEGMISGIPWQHLIASVPFHPVAEYFDVSRDQVVIYVKDKIDNASKLRVYGRVFKVQGSSKRPGKTDQEYSEYSIVVDRYDVLE
jgi:hypothetical protein